MSYYKFNKDDAKRFGKEQGIGTRIHGNELRFSTCPYCRNKTDDKNTFSINLKTGQFKCLRESCGATGNMITLSKDFNFSLGSDVDEYYNRQRRFRNMAQFPRPEVRDPAIEYLEGRGISRAICEKYAITTQKEHPNILVFPFFDEDGKMQFVKYRKTNFDKSKDKAKEWCESNCKPILFGMDQCDHDRSKTLVLTEGQIDSLSVAEAFHGEINVVSVPTGAKGFTWVPYCWDWLGKFDTLVVFGDHEKDHITLLEEMKTRFHGCVKHVRPEDYQGHKDANELLLDAGPDAVVSAVMNAVIVEHPRIKKLAEVQRRSTADMEKISTGFRSLDRLIGGFFFGQLVVLTGERGYGKSTLGSQFMTRAVEQNCTAFYYSGELMDWFVQDWFDKQLAGAEHINCIESNLGYKNYVVDGSRLQQIHHWYSDKVYLFDNAILQDEETGTLLETVRTAIKQYGCRVIMLDNLMTAIDDMLDSDLYRLQANFVRELAEMAKAYEVLIFLVVHPRKAGIHAFSNDDVMGSSNITNLADVILRYTKPKQRNDDDPDHRPDRVLQVTKNRLNGRIDPEGIPTWYEESSKRISEKQKVFDWVFSWNDWEDVPEDELGDIPF